MSRKVGRFLFPSLLAVSGIAVAAAALLTVSAPLWVHLLIGRG